MSIGSGEYVHDYTFTLKIDDVIEPKKFSFDNIFVRK